MIEPLGAKQQEASALRAQALQGGARPEGMAGRSEAAAVAAMASGPYYSPVVRLDVETQRAVIMFRDVSTGKVQIQYPSERQLEAYRASLRQQTGQGEAQQADESRPTAETAAPSTDGGAAARFSSVGGQAEPAVHGLAAVAGGRARFPAVTA